MKVILLENIENIGKKYDVKEVKEGYAKNFLFPKKLAKPATREAMRWLEEQKEIIAKSAEESLKKVQETILKIDGAEILIPVKVGEEGQLFEKINSQKIAEHAKEAGFEIKKSQVALEKPIDTIGEYPVKIKFDDNLEAEVKVIITEEKQ